MADPTPTLPAAPANPQPFNFTPTAPPQFDPIALLPASAADKLRMLRQRSADAHRLVVPHADLQAASTARTDAKNALARLVAHASEGGFRLPDTDARVIAATKALARAEDEFKRLQDRSEARAQGWTATSQALANVETWLRTGRPGGTSLEAVEVDVPKPAKGESGLLDQIENRRGRVRELKAAEHTIESAPYPSSHAKRRLREIVEQLSREPDVTLLIEHDREVIWPTSRVQAEVYGAERALAFHEAVDVVGLFAYLLKPKASCRLLSVSLP
jgi:hypothetical protein